MNTLETVGDNLTAFFNVVAQNSLLHTALALLLAWIVAWILDRIVIAWLRIVIAKTNLGLDESLINLLRKPLFYTIFVLAFIFANTLVPISRFISTIVIPIFISLLLILWTAFLLKVTKILLQRMANNENHFPMLTPQTLPVFHNLAMIVIWVLSIYYILSSWDIDMSALLASAGIVGIAVGFAARDTLANLFSGVFIMADAPYKIGDCVVLESGERGEVTNIGLRSTRILTRDNIEITVPNSVIGNTKVINESGGPNTTYRIRCKVGVAYGSDIDQVRQTLQSIADEDNDICDFPKPVVRFRNFGDSGLEFELMGWIREPQFRGRITDQVLTTIYKRFADCRIEIPYSKHDIYIKQHSMSRDDDLPSTAMLHLNQQPRE
ncbi:mechanosensitive ion channel family protein [Thalassotalea ponticola]|uniref:mechanosensitive ion channel family protein n=1 Tax=Thalassotalea ponticola TaxID=1523392 RepID=UPI0025B293C0|nr:mechanosensitive ion channel family protein [Thalassotalea ponticola]MDN3653014.1 mechanosensitive ion channel family protein [Thalassotalea ponticola]